MMGHSLWLWGDLIVKTLPLSSNFLLTKKGGLEDLCGLCGTWTLKSELWASEFALLSSSHPCYPVNYTNIAACCRIIQKDRHLWTKPQKMTIATNGERWKKGETSRKL